MPVRWHPSISRTPVVAAAAPLAEMPVVDRNLFTYVSWQDEAWEYWRNLGELNQGISWLCNSLARVRLIAAEQIPGEHEPQPLKEGLAADLMNVFAGGTSGQAGFNSMMTAQLGIPGEGWLVVERDSVDIDLQLASWKAVPTTALRPKQGKDPVKLRVGESLWRPLADEGLATKIWKEDPQFPWRAWSPVQAALPILRRIDLVDRRIVAVMVSRLAANGLLLIPQEGTFNLPAPYKDAADGFVRFLIDSASNGIARPGTASAALPLVIKFAADMIDKWKILKWDDILPAELLDEREREIKRLAVTLSMPVEWLTGMGDVKFWNAFHLTEEAVKLYVVPYAEIICGGVTTGYLHAMLKQLGEPLLGPNGGAIVCWYDTSELTQPPDKSQHATDAYDRGELNGEGLLHYLDLDEQYRLEEGEYENYALRRMLSTPATATAALAEIRGTPTPEAGTGTAALGDSFGPPAENEPPAALPPAPPQTAAGLRRPSPRPRHALTHR